ncbi:c-type cytochrome [Paraflavitalea pollutisoli]|uniref:c-type cytochrome n=1 Tax=Paraflavitalea pollutisoli TaxID=3034143 RepID=UPI0023ED66C1|nr:cytochrome c [Paraflavitalea sp. H1-2-19X]
MNTEVGYVARGFLLMLVVLAGLEVVHFLSTNIAKAPVADINLDNKDAYRSQTNSMGIPAVLNERGKWLFTENCSSCHQPDKDCDVTQLATVEKRVRDKALLRGWIRNSDSVLKTGNPYYTKLFADWRQTPMPAFPHLSDADIDEILEYMPRARY